MSHWYATDRYDPPGDRHVRGENRACGRHTERLRYAFERIRSVRHLAGPELAGKPT